MQEQMKGSIFDLREKLGSAEQQVMFKSQQNDLLEQEVQQLRGQLGQVNQFIQLVQ